MAVIDWLTLLSAGALALSVLIYVLLDGTDLGVGLLLGAHRHPEDRDVMTLSILPIWDANETWLVLAGGGLLALFPQAYATLLPALYLPLLLMFMALILRAVGLEFREHLQHKGRADLALGGGSLVVTLCQGWVMGSLLQGIPTDGGPAFPLYCGLALVVGYAWLGSCWLYWRSDGALHRRSGRLARCLAALMVPVMAGLLGWTLGLEAQYLRRLTQPWVAVPSAVLAIALLWGHYRAFGSRHHCLPLFLALGVVVLAFALMVIALFPWVVPPSLTLQQTAASRSTQVFMLAGFAVVVPITLAYNTWGFRVFAGKIRGERR